MRPLSDHAQRARGTSLIALLLRDIQAGHAGSPDYLFTLPQRGLSRADLATAADEGHGTLLETFQDIHSYFSQHAKRHNRYLTTALELKCSALLCIDSEYTAAKPMSPGC